MILIVKYSTMKSNFWYISFGRNLTFILLIYGRYYRNHATSLKTKTCQNNYFVESWWRQHFRISNYFRLQSQLAQSAGLFLVKSQMNLSRSSFDHNEPPRI